ncbi:hypothetical protein [Chitinophaga deserti]|uniref:hypothetical protein n=1 Tax=Chitinophaga deserti TaxID=2164099 RepID=UPI000D6CC4E7|nr:hypothetical protein [Chitinophaga deserti]
MTKFKFTAMAVAILTIGATFALNANALGKRSVTSCFRNVVLQNAAGTYFYTPDIADPRATVEAAIVTNAIKYLDATPSTLTTLGSLNSNFYSCIKLTETFDYLPNVSQFSISGVTAKWVVHEILYKPTWN